MNWFKNLFKKKESLRDKCVTAYGDEFGEMYDAINRGETIGGFLETAAFIDMLEVVKRGEPIKIDDTIKLIESKIKVTGVFIPGQNGQPDINISFNK